MSTSTARTSVYQLITDRIVALLESGTVPWRQPWSGTESAPRSLGTLKPYRGINAFLLSAVRYRSPYWVTFRQANELGGHVRKGERGFPVVFWKWLDKRPDGDDEDATPVRGRFPFLRYYTVFNVAQCSLPADIVPAPAAPRSEFTAIEAAEKIVAGMPNPPTIEHGHAGAWYRPSADLVGMPDRPTFDNPAAYYATLFHELTHSTGHADRLQPSKMLVR